MLQASLPTFEHLHRLRAGAVHAPADVASFSVSGSGALACLQGLWTNDILKPGDATVTYGAVLTPKGMVVADGWLLRLGDGALLLVAASMREPVAQLLKRALPPRLAAFADETDARAAVVLLGDAARDLWPVLPLGRLPEPGGCTQAQAPGATFLVAAPVLGPFVAVLVAEPQAMESLTGVLDAARIARGAGADREAARILAGWPAVGAEIDDRTLPQEVRFDEHLGVSYTKGCYTGQETVARLHFRGHANRTLLGLRWVGPYVEGAEVTAGAKVVGRVGSVLLLPDRVLATALLRRELRPGHHVNVAGAAAVVTDLPFGPGEVEG